MLFRLSKAPRNTWRDFLSDIELPDFQSFGHCTRGFATRDDKTSEAKIARFDGAGGQRGLDDRPGPFSSELVLGRTDFVWGCGGVNDGCPIGGSSR